MLVLIATAWLCRWSERRLRVIISEAVNQHLARTMRPSQYLLLDISLVQSTQLAFTRKVRDITVGSPGRQAELRLMLNTFTAFTRRPGVALFRLFITSAEVLRSPAFESSISQVQQYMDETLRE